MKCPRCQGKTVLVPARVTVRTDGGFPLTGTVDKRVGGQPITGRKDWENRLKEKGLVPMTNNDMDNAERKTPDHKKEFDKIFQA